MPFKGRLAATLMAGSLGVAAPSVPAWAHDAGPGTPDKWDAWTELSGYLANTPGARRGEAALWMPFAQDGRSLIFGDFRGKLFEEDQREGNAAIGYRFVSETGWNPGFWAGFDRRRTQLGTTFDQVSFGGELLSADWDIRVNGYLPLKDSELISSIASGTGSVEVVGSEIFLTPLGATSLYELALHGFDGEIGYRVPLERLGAGRDESPSKRHSDLRVFLGGYYFDHDDFEGEVAGPRIRAEWRIEDVIEQWEGSRLTFEAAYQYDDVREEQFEAGLRLRIPLGGGSSSIDRPALSPQEKRMSEGIKRDTDVVAVSQTKTTGGSGLPEPVEDALSSVDLETVVSVANGDNLTTALTGAGANVLIVVAGGAMDFEGSFFVGPNQTLLGGGGSIQVRGLTTGALGAYTAPGTTPRIAVSNGPVIFADDNTHIAGVIIDGLGNANRGLTVVPDATAFLTGSTIQNSGAGIGLGAGNNRVSLTVRNSTIKDSISHGIEISGDDVTVDIRDSIIENVPTGSAIIVFTLGTANLTIANTTLEGDFGDYALTFLGGVTTVTNSTGNVDRITDAIRCFTASSAGFGSFTGFIGFSDETIVDSNFCAGP
jgi:hypothetical protein